MENIDYDKMHKCYHKFGKYYSIVDRVEHGIVYTKDGIEMKLTENECLVQPDHFDDNGKPISGSISNKPRRKPQAGDYLTVCYNLGTDSIIKSVMSPKNFKDRVIIGNWDDRMPVWMT